MASPLGLPTAATSGPHAAAGLRPRGRACPGAARTSRIGRRSRPGAVSGSSRGAEPPAGDPARDRAAGPGRIRAVPAPWVVACTSSSAGSSIPARSAVPHGRCAARAVDRPGAVGAASSHAPPNEASVSCSRSPRRRSIRPRPGRERAVRVRQGGDGSVGRVRSCRPRPSSPGAATIGRAAARRASRQRDQAAFRTTSASPALRREAGPRSRSRCSASPATAHAPSPAQAAMPRSTVRSPSKGAARRAAVNDVRSFAISLGQPRREPSPFRSLSETFLVFRRRLARGPVASRPRSAAPAGRGDAPRTGVLGTVASDPIGEGRDGAPRDADSARAGARSARRGGRRQDLRHRASGAGSSAVPRLGRRSASRPARRTGAGPSSATAPSLFRPANPS